MTLMEELTRLTGQLDEDRVPYVLVGGLAVAVWGAPRATKDIDLLVRDSDLSAALASARKRGFGLEALPLEFNDGMRLQRVTKVEGMAHLTLDLILVDRNLEPVWQSRQTVQTETGPMVVAGRDALIKMKLAAGRQQDLLDVQKLQEIDR